MEDNELKTEEQPLEPAGNFAARKVGFPQVRKEKSEKGKLVFIILAILALVSIGVWLVKGKIFKGGVSDYEKISPTPVEAVSFTVTATPFNLKKEEIKIQVLNGSGISGAAKDLKEELEGLGYSDVEVGNASKQDYEITMVSFSRNVNQEEMDNILDKLREIYEEVDYETEDLENFDIKIITGLPKNYKLTPSVKPTSSPTPTVSLTPTVTPKR